MEPATTGAMENPILLAIRVLNAEQQKEDVSVRELYLNVTDAAN